MLTKNLLACTAVCLSCALAACGSLRDRDNDDDSDRDSDGSRTDFIDNDDDELVGDGGGDGGDGDAGDGGGGDADGGDGGDGGIDDVPPGGGDDDGGAGDGGAGDAGGGRGNEGGDDPGGGGEGADDSDPPPVDAPPEQQPAACPGVPSEGLCTFEAGSLVAKNCRDGAIVTRFCTPNETFVDPDNRCDITPTGALCRDTWEVKVETENPIYFCFAPGGDFAMGLFEGGNAELLVDATDESEFGTFFITGEDAIDRIAAINVQIAGRPEMIFFANHSLGVAASLRDLEGSGTTCTVVNYDDETTLNISLNCELDVGFGFDPVQSVLEFYPNGQVLSWDEFNNFAEPQEFGGYYLEGDNIYFAFDQGPFDYPLAREGTVSGNSVLIDGDFDFSCE